MRKLGPSLWNRVLAAEIEFALHAGIQEILTLVATGRGVCLVPATVAQRYPRDDVCYVQVSDADPAVVSLAWMRETSRPVIEAFIQVARQVARSDLRANGSAGQPPLAGDRLDQSDEGPR